MAVRLSIMKTKSHYFIYAFSCFVLFCIVPGCFIEDDSFTIQSTYAKIRSYPNGGGVFILSMIPEENFFGSVQLSLDADPALHAQLSTTTLSREVSVAEVTIHPDDSAAIQTYAMTVHATHFWKTIDVPLAVDMYVWGQSDTETATAKSLEFIEWLKINRPEFEGLEAEDWFIYMTYPEILVVEHWTFLNAAWEMRVCFHVMIPPYDWSMIRLRRRGAVAPVFAAKRECAEDNSTYSIHEIAVDEYPTFFDY
jgi:hypothetical protein